MHVLVVEDDQKIAASIAGYVAYRHVETGFIPKMDEGGFVLDYVSAPGTSLTETDRLLRQCEEIIRATPEVAMYSRRTGLQMGGSLTEANQGDIFISSSRRRAGASRRSSRTCVSA